MLKTLKIRNFESHRNTQLNFHPGVNVIVGESDQGKTAILRALEWVLFNNPLGEDIKSNWLEDINTYVQAEFDDGILKRKRTKSFNGYVFNDEKFQAFKNKIPESIRSFVNMDAINLLSQDDPLFMIGWKPSERGRYLNEICDMKIIDTTTSNINKEIRAGNARIKVLKETLERSEEDLADFEDLEVVEGKLAAIEQEAEKIRNLEEDCDQLTEIIENYRSIDSRKQKYAGVLKFSDRIDKLLKEQQKIVIEEKEIIWLEHFLEELEEKTEDLKEAKELKKKYHKRFEDLMPSICPLCNQPILEKYKCQEK